MTNILIQPPVGSSLTLNWPNKKIPQTAPSSSFQQTAGSGTTDSHLLFLADTKAALVYLNEHFSGRVDLIYLDPPFASQATYHQRTASGEKIPQYDDHWDDSRYLQFLLEVLLLLRMLMSDKGTLYLHCDHHHQHHLRMVLDEVFGAKHFMNHLVWGYKTGGVPEKKGFSKNTLIFINSPESSLQFSMTFQHITL